LPAAPAAGQHRVREFCSGDRQRIGGGTPQAFETPRENCCRFDGDASGRRIYGYTENDPLNGVDLSGLDEDPFCEGSCGGGGGGGGGGGTYVTQYIFTGATSGQDYGSLISYDGGAGADAAAANGGVVGTIPAGAYGISLTGAGNIGYSLDGGGSGSEGSPVTVIGGLLRTGIVTAPEGMPQAVVENVSFYSYPFHQNILNAGIKYIGLGDNRFQSIVSKHGPSTNRVQAGKATSIFLPQYISSRTAFETSIVQPATSDAAPTPPTVQSDGYRMDITTDLRYPIGTNLQGNSSSVVELRLLPSMGLIGQMVGSYYITGALIR